MFVNFRHRKILFTVEEEKKTATFIKESTFTSQTSGVLDPYL